MPQKIKVGGVIQNDHLASVSVLAVKDQPGIAAAVLDALGKRALNVQFIVQVIDHQEQDQIVICIDRDDLLAGEEAIQEICCEVQPAAVVANPQVASLAIFGPDFRQRPGIAATMFRALAERGVNILAISTSISTVTCVVEAARLKEALAGVNQYFDLP